MALQQTRASESEPAAKRTSLEVFIFSQILTHCSKNRNERQKIEPVPLPLPRASRNFSAVKTRNKKNPMLGLRR